MKASHITATKTGSASSQWGGVAVSGVVNGDIFASAPVRSRYEEQVRRIAPQQLIGREKELAELNLFCTASQIPNRYRWWQAGAWAGKSALMSWFVLNPPIGVRIVSFFVTARLANQADRVAFADNVLEQLAALTNEPIPAYLTASTREAHLLGLLRDAAHLCRDRGERLVLLVDGLDEDTGPDSYSVAALLPAEPAADMRVIVAGRPNPPIPSDVPDHHPLRDPAILYPLPASAAATAVRGDMERDLDRMLNGSETDRDLLGLLVAAGGGLSGPDLAELASCTLRQIERKLGTVAGRSFASRRSHWQSGFEQVAYVMGHEELQQTAMAELGAKPLDTYRQRLHAWADEYRRHGWPENTPEYLLRGYHRLLASTQDLDRMVASVTDVARQDRMLERSGSDAEALNNTLETMRAIAGSTTPDIAALARVIMYRDRLHDRNTSIPAHLPALWAELGHFQRAEKLVYLVSEMDYATEAPTALMQVLVLNGHADRAERIARSLAERPDAPVEAAADLVRIMAEAKSLELSRRFARSLTDTKQRIGAFAELAEAEAERGNDVEARQLVSDVRAMTASLPIPEARDRMATRVVQALVAVGEHNEAEQVVRATAHWEAAPRAAAMLVRCLARAGNLDRADALLVLTKRTSALDVAIADLVKIAAGSGDMERAATVCRAHEQTYVGSRAQLNLVQAHLQAGEFAQAGKVGQKIQDTRLRGEACGALVRALAESGDAKRAQEMVDSIPDCRPAALTGLAWAMVTAGRLDEAAALAQEAQRATHLVRDIYAKDRSACDLIEAIAAANGHDPATEGLIAAHVETKRQDNVISSRVMGLIHFGDLREAERHAVTVPDVTERLRLLAKIADAAAISDPNHALSLVNTIEQLLSELPDPYFQAEQGCTLADLLATLGDAVRARRTAAWVERQLASIQPPNRRVSLLGALAKVMLKTGDMRQTERFMRLVNDDEDGYTTQRAARILVETAVKLGRNVGQATAIAKSVVDPDYFDWLSSAHVRGLAESGDLDEAERLAWAIDSVDARAFALTDVATHAGADRAVELADHIMTHRLTPDYAHERSWLLLALAEVVAPAAAIRILAEAYPSFLWHGPLTTVAKVCPAVLPSIVDEFVRLQRKYAQST